jgi:hypothetical protein
MAVMTVFVASVFFVPRTDAQTTESKPTEEAESTEPLPISQVAKYLDTARHNTTLTDGRIRQRLVGHVYKGIVEVSNVSGVDKSLNVSTQLGKNGNAFFKITKPEVIKKAAELPRGANISITAKLSYVGTDRSAQASQASFNETQSVEIVPAEKSPAKN